MKCLTIKQPWADLIINGYKDIENRSFRFNYEGPLSIHAGKSFDHRGYQFIWDRFKDIYLGPKDHYLTGHIIGQVEVVDVVSEHESPWFFGDYGYVLENPIKFKKPIPWRGQLGFFNVPDEVLKGAVCPKNQKWLTWEWLTDGTKHPRS